MPRPNSRDPETDPAAFFGKELKRMRLAAGFGTQDALAAALGFSREVVSKSENGYQPPTDDVLTLWLDTCRVVGSERDMIERMVVLARRARGPVPQFFEKYLAAEEGAEFLRLWAHVQVPGLLQAEEYALAMYDLPGIDRDEAAATVAVRMGRQSIMDGPDPVQVIAVLDESVLYRCIGTPEVMVRQLGRLLEMSERPNVTIQAAQGAAAYWGLSGGFEIASCEGMPDTLLMLAMEDQTSEDRTMTRKALILFEKLRGYALNIGDSRAVIMEARDHWNSQQ